jgi:hypothetical protein
MKTPGIKYGHDRNGNEIYPRDGERILEEGEPLPAVYRPWLNGSGWLGPTKLHTHPGANLTACVFGNYWAYAVPERQPVQPVIQEVEKPAEPILVVPEAIPDPVSEPTPVVKTKKRRAQERPITNELMFDDE